MPTAPAEKKRIVISIGDPSGVGPEVVAAALSAVRDRARFLLVGSHKIFTRAAKIVGLSPAEVKPVDFPSFNNAMQIYEPAPWKGALPVFGQPNGATGAYSFQWAEVAARLCTNGTADAVVTAPICKAAWHAAGKNYPGHTELLGAIGESNEQLMLLATPFVNGQGLRVALVTAHTPLAQVAGQINHDKIIHSCVVLHNELQSRLGVFNPRLAVLGLNPHAGENGEIGDEEVRVIAPAVAALQQHGLNVVGPLSADTAFFRMWQEKAFDAILAMYHDQGLAPLKTVAFFGGVNITLGLSIVRTSPDHGTAFNLAGTGGANAESMINAMVVALDILETEKRVRRALAKDGQASRQIFERVFLTAQTLVPGVTPENLYLLYRSGKLDAILPALAADLGFTEDAIRRAFAEMLQQQR
ncbi:4-hydroxythreonine-4-phosphate dehydrogenase [Planctomycetales bacterium]|nr:4-hydroxythreonine-4-phosphate dehydrogenase [Planctomycetales bacterium]